MFRNQPKQKLKSKSTRVVVFITPTCIISLWYGAPTLWPSRGGGAKQQQSPLPSPRQKSAIPPLQTKRWMHVYSHPWVQSTINQPRLACLGLATSPPLPSPHSPSDMFRPGNNQNTGTRRCLRLKKVAREGFAKSLTPNKSKIPNPGQVTTTALITFLPPPRPAPGYPTPFPSSPFLSSVCARFG